MKSALETLSPTRVKLTVEVPFEELKPSLDAAIKHIGEHVQVPGFRKGKVPARIIEQRVGRAAVLEEAVNNALPDLYGRALEENDVRPLGQPEITDLKVPATDGEDFSFTAEVDRRPEIELPDFSDIELTVDEAVVSDDDVAERLDALRARFGTLKGVDRPVQDGDFVSIDLSAEIDGEEIDAVNGVSYEVGSKNMLEGMDEALVGMAADETKSFVAPLAGGDQEGREANCTVTVLAVKERELPELDDEFAQLASEFDTLEELKADLTQKAEVDAKFAQGVSARDQLLDAILGRVEVPIPEGIVEAEVNSHLEGEGRLEDDEHRAEVDESTRKGLKTQLLLDAIAEREEVQVQQAELIEFLVMNAQQYGMDPNAFAQTLDKEGQIPAMVAEVARRKALASVLEKVSVKDTAGNVVDLNEAVPGTEADEDEPVDAEADGAGDIEAAEAQPTDAPVAEADEADEADEAAKA
ncbi:trigger factor [Intrasporangium calvum]|uniref:Trigger factor n=1 Tax=Intrasporangium calvum (strain ATCC 23552 / DSM 43043 / JCM 3097 / NBRC 12989 / NCIMB 10167 / NRRL B-3866 / 7 KIP) TaxID=710696 RepID=E6S6Z1_INTC7|nr:trigger factor [Intrasporangium calvum]ADU47886.1 trigger factor [Intrasporangium calvum DSM 43043]